MCGDAQLTGTARPKQGEEDGTHNATRDSGLRDTRDGHHHERGFPMKIDTSRSYTVVELRSLLLSAEDNTQIEFTRTLKKDQVKLCWCGCGNTTKGKFAPGHDSRFHSLAKQVARGQEDLEVALLGLEHDEARAEFTKCVDHERPLWAEKQAKVAAEKAAKPAKVEKAIAAVAALVAEEGDEEADLMARLGL